MKKNLWLVVLCFIGVTGTAFGQMYGDYRSYRSGSWNMTSTWEEWGGITWVPAVSVPSSASHNVVIWGGHVVTVPSGSNASVSYLTIHAGQLIVESGATFTVANEVIIDDPNALLSVSGTLINNGTIKLQQGGFGLGTLVNNGSVDIAGIFNIGQGTITGNDLSYLPGATVNFSNSSQSYEDLNIVWPTANGPTNVTINGRFNLNGIRTVPGNLNINGTLQVNGSLTVDGTTNANGPVRVAGTFTNNGPALFRDSLVISGEYINNGSVEIKGKVVMKNGGSASGSNFVYTGISNKLAFYLGTNLVDHSTLFGSGTSTPLLVDFYYADVTLNTPIDIYHDMHVTGNVIVNDTLTNNGSIDTYGIFDITGGLINNSSLLIGNDSMHVSGKFINNGTTQVNYGMLDVGGTLINSGSMSIKGTFQFNQGGTVSGNQFVYDYGNLIFNHTSGSYAVDTGSVFWPYTDGPWNVILQGTGGIIINVPRTVSSFLTSAPVINAYNLSVSYEIQINSGGLFDSSPCYTGDASLGYVISGPYNVGPEWINGDSVGAGVPRSITIGQNTILTMPNSPRTCIGDFTNYGTLVLSTTPGADFTVNGNWRNNLGDMGSYGTLVPNLRNINFNGVTEQIISGINMFDFLTIDNPAGVKIPGINGEGGSAADSVIVNRKLTLVNGNIRLGNVFKGILMINDSLAGITPDRFIVTYGGGYVARTITGGGSYQFPIGSTETSYNPLTITLAPSDPAETFSVRIDSTMGDSLYIQRTWYVEEVTEGDNHASLTFQWYGADEGTNFNRNMSSTYHFNDNTFEYTEFENGAVSGTDPYIVTTSGGFPCTHFTSQYGNSIYTVGTSGALTSVESPEKEIPATFALNQNYPNPFNPSTVISYKLPGAANISLKIYDILGKEVASLAHGYKEAGSYSATFNADKLASGIYIARFTAQPQNGDRPFIQIKKMMLMK